MIKLLTIMSLALFIQPCFPSETVAGAKKDLDKFKQDMSVELKNIENNLKVISEKAQKKGDATYKEAVKELTARRDKLRSDLYDLQADAKGEWTNVKGKLASSINELNQKIQKVLKD
jgi:hypothetical protein